ncbi:MAG: hypothetical protein HY738_24220, partial [Bacteroidia bacterium]|nr:hypothetical protein [Bacteroidia bacterium]
DQTAIFSNTIFTPKLSIGVPSPQAPFDLQGDAIIRGWLYVEDGVVVGKRFQGSAAEVDTLRPAPQSPQQTVAIPSAISRKIVSDTLRSLEVEMQKATITEGTAVKFAAERITVDTIETQKMELEKLLADSITSQKVEAAQMVTDTMYSSKVQTDKIETTGDIKVGTEIKIDGTTGTITSGSLATNNMALNGTLKLLNLEQNLTGTNQILIADVAGNVKAMPPSGNLSNLDRINNCITATSPLCNIGIGQSNPKDNLQIGSHLTLHNDALSSFISRNLYADGAYYRLYSSEGVAAMFFRSDGSIKFGTLVADATSVSFPTNKGLFIKNNGDVGIGTETPGANLEVNGTVKIGTLNEITNPQFLVVNDNDHIIGKKSLNNLLDINDCITVDDDDCDVYIGAASPANLDVNGEINVNNTIKFDDAGIGIASGNENLVLGSLVTKINDGNYNILIGKNVGISTTGGTSNVFIGYDAGKNNTSGNDNTYIGKGAGEYRTDGSRNVCVGTDAGNRYQLIGNGSDNTFVGSQAGSKCQTSNNTYIGSQAGFSNKNGTSNTFIGVGAGCESTGSHNIFVGTCAGLWETGSHKLIIEEACGQNIVPLIYGEFDNDLLRFNAKVGIGILPTSNDEKLRISGAITVGANINTQPPAGTICWTGSDFMGYGGLSVGWLSLTGASLWTKTGSNDIYYNDGYVGIGTCAPSEKLTVNGRIKSRNEIYISETGPWCDFVFDKNYKLLSLEEVEQYININKHLVGIPSGKEIESEGLKVGDMITKMMQKIEELTLYIIELNNKIKEFEKNQNLEKLNTE